jgi:quinohemoprotein ethanol dehydrogenase
MFVDTSDGTNWPTYGRTYDEGHFSPLTEVNAGNISELHLAWFIDLPKMISAMGEPLAVHGVLYFAVGYSVVYAADGATGKVLWRYDPKVTEVTNDKLKCAWGIRGLAYSNKRVFVGTQDGRLLALSAKTGQLLWSVQTIDPTDASYITGAPRVFNGKVIIGFGGADVGPIRGYVTAYDAVTGRQAWRFYVVPSDPAKGFEDKAMEMAAKTWTGKWWRYGGGGTVWNAITYDHKYNRIYLGTGNGAPWNRDIRSPGGGDNLFLSAIVALDADTGAYLWHYQTTPGESWDYNSDMDIELATLTIEGRNRDVILHAPKNGFFYVIDRADGKLISAEPYAKVTWASRIDIKTGRPVENPAARFPDGETVIYPGSAGAHSTLAMSYSPRTKLSYIPTIFTAGYYNSKGIDPATWKHPPHPAEASGFNPSSFGPIPMGKQASSNSDGAWLTALQAWNPVTQKIAWSVPSQTVNGGVLTTAGNLIFQGQADGTLQARAADTGKLLWSANAQNGISGDPITYFVNGKQYISVIAGFSGSVALFGEAVARFGWRYQTQMRRVLTFALGGTATLPKEATHPPEEILADEGFEVDPVKSKQGRVVYLKHCEACHGPNAVAGGVAPDLRASPTPLSAEAFNNVVREGVLKFAGMPQFDELVTDEVESLRHYIREEAEIALRQSATQKPAAVNR